MIFRSWQLPEQKAALHLCSEWLTLRIMRTHSVARLRADVVTSRGCTTFSSSILLTMPCTKQKLVPDHSQNIFSTLDLLFGPLLLPVAKATSTYHANMLSQYLADVDACSSLSLRMPVAQLGDNVDGVQPCVLRQSGWHHLQRLSKRAHAVGLHTLSALPISSSHCAAQRAQNLHGAAVSGLVCISQTSICDQCHTLRLHSYRDDSIKNMRWPPLT